MKSPYKLFGKRKSRSLQQECANLAGGPGSDPKATAARAQGREPGEMNESSEFNPNNKAYPSGFALPNSEYSDIADLLDLLG